MTYLLDSSVLTPGRLSALTIAAASRGTTLVIPALIHAERVFQLRRLHGTTFNATVIQSWFQSYAGVVVIEPLDVPAAESVASALHARYPVDADWRQAKCVAYHRCAGTQPPAGAGARRCGAPLDLYVAALASPQRPVITEDHGPEWGGAPEGSVLRYEEALLRLQAA